MLSLLYPYSPLFWEMKNIIRIYFNVNFPAVRKEKQGENTE